MNKTGREQIDRLVKFTKKKNSQLQTVLNEDTQNKPEMQMIACNDCCHGSYGKR
jgi:hypothetical protein